MFYHTPKIFQTHLLIFFTAIVAAIATAGFIIKTHSKELLFGCLFFYSFY